MLQPTNYWQWRLDSEKRLMLDIDASMAFTTAYHKKQLTMDVVNDTSFNLEDAAYYQQLSAKLQELECWSTPEVVQIALNAVAAKRYYKPMMPKSWFFKTNSVAAQFQSVFEADETCQLYSELGGATVLIVEQCGNAAVCMLLDEQFSLDEDKVMQQFDIIKVMNDRLFCREQIRQLKYA